MQVPLALNTILLGATAVLLRIPNAFLLTVLLLGAQLLVVPAYGAIATFVGLLTRKYLLLGLVYGFVVEVGIGQTRPTSTRSRWPGIFGPCSSCPTRSRGRPIGRRATAGQSAGCCWYWRWSTWSSAPVGSTSANTVRARRTSCNVPLASASSRGELLRARLSFDLQPRPRSNSALRSVASWRGELPAFRPRSFGAPMRARLSFIRSSTSGLVVTRPSIPSVGAGSRRRLPRLRR